VHLHVLTNTQAKDTFFTMEQEQLVEAAFLIPIREDRDVGNGRLHPYTRWQRLTRDLYHMFAGWSRTPGLVEGVYKDPDTSQPVADKSRRYVVALPHRELDRLRHYLQEVGAVFRQKVIYLSVAGQVEFVEARYEEISDPEARDL
jgi:hypothetical protein